MRLNLEQLEVYDMIIFIREHVDISDRNETTFLSSRSVRFDKNFEKLVRVRFIFEKDSSI